MAKPSRNCSTEKIQGDSRTFFATSKTIQGRALLQTERNANLFIDVLRSYASGGKFKVHDFVVMPDHFHVLLTVDKDASIEKAIQLIKGGFSFRVKVEFGYQGEIWQRGFSEVRVLDRISFLRYREYINSNPVKAGIVDSPEKFPFGSAYLKSRKSETGAKTQAIASFGGTTKVVP